MLGINLPGEMILLCDIAAKILAICFLPNVGTHTHVYIHTPTELIHWAEARGSNRPHSVIVNRPGSVKYEPPSDGGVCVW